MKKLTHKDYSIEDMESLLNQIADFRDLVKSTHDSTDPGFIQEYKLFKQYVKWVSEDLSSDSYICTLQNAPDKSLRSLKK